MARVVFLRIVIDIKLRITISRASWEAEMQAIQETSPCNTTLFFGPLYQSLPRPLLLPLIITPSYHLLLSARAGEAVGSLASAVQQPNTKSRFHPVVIGAGLDGGFVWRTRGSGLTPIS